MLSVGTDGQSQFLGNSVEELNQNLSISETSPLVVDTIGRTAYWYSPSANLIYGQSLHSGSAQVSVFPTQVRIMFLPIPVSILPSMLVFLHPC